MVTLVGTQNNFHEAIHSMLELEYDAIAAYESAIKRLENSEYKKIFENFKSDHLRHKEVLSSMLKEHNIDIPTEGDMKQLLTQGKVVITSLMGDEAILKAMKTNEDDTNTAYERLSNHKDASEVLKQSCNKMLEDERKHRAWIQDTLNHISK